ncbi:MAG: DUF1152 domain-containing protein [Thermoprotei archaeon]
MLPFNKKSYLILAVGGGGDVATAAALAVILRRHGYRTVVGSIVWERFTIDPTPGPIPIRNIVNCREIGEHACIVDKSSYALRRGRKIIFQAVNAAKALGEEVIVVDITEGVKGYKRGIESILAHFGLDGVIGVDVGGDILAHGFEENLWSPLADSLGLAVLTKISESYLVVHGLGSDGELSLDYLFERLGIVAKHKGLLGITGFTSREIELLENIFKYVESEASYNTLLALKGFTGYRKIRLGTRKVYISPLNLVSFILDPHVVYRESLLARTVDNTSSIEEARRRLNAIGIYTEYDLEEDLARRGLNAEKAIDGALIVKIREEGKRRLVKR